MVTKAPKFAVVLSGCGVYDGSEIHEAVAVMLAIDERGCEYQCFAPNTWQARTIDHFTGEASAIAGDADNRNVLAESARIARGNILDLQEFCAEDFDAIVFTGGFGAAMNLSDFALRGAKCEVNEEVRRVIEESYAAKVVIGAMCIAPVIVARVLGKYKVKLTVGRDKNTAAGICQMGAVHQECAVDEACVDEKNRIVTTPAYMSAKSIKQVYQGAMALVDEVLELV